MEDKKLVPNARIRFPNSVWGMTLSDSQDALIIQGSEYFAEYAGDHVYFYYTGPKFPKPVIVFCAIVDVVFLSDEESEKREIKKALPFYFGQSLTKQGILNGYLYVLIDIKGNVFLGSFIDVSFAKIYGVYNNILPLEFLKEFSPVYDQNGVHILSTI